jgi:hypothetical protein
MDDHEHISNGIQKFDGRNYACWSDRVKTYLTSLGVDIWYLLSPNIGSLPLNWGILD